MLIRARTRDRESHATALMHARALLLLPVAVWIAMCLGARRTAHVSMSDSLTDRRSGKATQKRSNG